MSTPSVSVVLAVYNGLPYLRPAVESILAQTYRDFELIVVDDGSTDGTGDYLRDRARGDGRVVLLRNEPNRGVAHSRNRAMEAAQGAYIAYHDADDVSLPHRLARQISFLEQHSEIGLAGAWAQYTTEQGRPTDGLVRCEANDNASLQSHLLDANCFCAGTVVVRRACLERVGDFDQDLAPSEDYDLWLRVAEVTQISIIPEVLYHYRQHANSASHRRRDVQMYNKALAVERALGRRFGSTPPESLLELAARDYLRSVYLAFGNGNHELAGQAYARAVALAPRLRHQGSLVEQVMQRYLRSHPQPDPIAFVGALFGNVFDQTPHLARLQRRLSAGLHMQHVFEAAKTGVTEPIDEHLWTGIRQDPRWLGNRGVLALAFRRLLKSRSAARSMPPQQRQR